MSVGLTMKMKTQFFDRRAVTSRLDKAARKNLSRFGAFTRRRARTSIRRSKKSSQPGQPPRAHSRDKTVTIKNILFAYDPGAKSVIIGPVKLNGQQGNVPEVLEKGGTTTIASGPRRRRRKRTVRIAARPFMLPAYQAEKPKFPQIWRDSVK